MRQYIQLLETCLTKGIEKENRTGTNTIGYIGDFKKYDLSEGFPIVTTKHMGLKSVTGEMLGFLRGYTNAADFRKLKCNVWDANANENQQWLNNPNRKGTDDLGNIYGAMARKWPLGYGHVDQLKKVVNNLSKGIDTRREIVSHWNPSEFHNMALLPCHMMYQFGIQGDRLDLSMYQRSCDVPLGVPYNIAGYSWLLSVVAQITGLKAGSFNHFMHDIHIYKNQIELAKLQVSRVPLKLPELSINPDIKTLNDLETWVTPDDFTLSNYDHYEKIKYPFSV